MIPIATGKRLTIINTFQSTNMGCQWTLKSQSIQFSIGPTKIGSKLAAIPPSLMSFPIFPQINLAFPQPAGMFPDLDLGPRLHQRIADCLSQCLRNKIQGESILQKKTPKKTQHEAQPSIASNFWRNTMHPLLGGAITILKNMKVSWELGWLSHIFFEKNVPNHQPD